MASRRHALSISLRVSAVVLALATVGAIASTGADALQGRQLIATHTPSQASQVVTESNDEAATQSAPVTEVAPQPATGASSDSMPGIAAPLAAAPSPTEAGVNAPVVDEGRTELGDGLFAVRDGRSVTVHFDVPQARTRRRDKFDRIVRETLPRIYGPAAQAVLDGIPQGEIVAAGKLPAELGESGVRIPLGDNSMIALWPELREARGGPLVVGYRAEMGR